MQNEQLANERIVPVRRSAAPQSRSNQRDAPPAVSTREAGAILGRSERSVQRAIANGEIAATRVGTAYRISREELTRLASSSTTPPSDPPLATIVALPTLAERMTSLPAPMSSFIGRGADLAVLLALLDDPAVRLLTLTGPGGIGKTRLSLAAAHALDESRFPDGVVFVALADVQHPGMVIPAIAQALGLRTHSDRDPAERVRTFLRRKQLLLVLDNFEHVLAAGPDVAQLLAEAQATRMLVTSRAPLRVVGERELAVQPMAVAEGGATAEAVLASDAGQLFAERAREHDASFTIDEASAPLIAELCARLDGLPLAIELAAARVKVLPPGQLLARFEQRLPLLNRGPHNAPARHRTMRDAIAWSYDLLSAPEQALFRRLAVFEGGFSLDAVAWMADGVTPSSPDHLDLVTNFVDHSLVTIDCRPNDEAHFRLLETIREFGLERLAAAGEEQEARASLAAYMQALMASLGAHELVSSSKLALDRLRARQADLQAVLAWLEDHDPPAFVRLVAKLPTYWYGSGYYREAQEWLERALPYAAAATALDVARMQVGRSRFQVLRGEYELAAAGFDHGIPELRLHGSKVEAAMALMWRAGLAMFTSDNEVAEAKYAEACQVAEQVADPRTRAMLLGFFMANLGVAARGRGEFDLAETRLLRAQEHFQAHDKTLDGNESSLAMTHLAFDELGQLALDRGDYALALSHYQAFLERAGEHDDMQTVEAVLVGVARVATAWGRLPSAARLFAMADTLQQRLGLAMSMPGDLAGHEQDLATVQSQLGEAAFAAEWRKGSQFSLGAARSETVALAPETLPGEETSTGVSCTVDALTRRELDVLRLLAQYKTDQEIADALYLSLRTVNWHVRSILAKLDVPSRRAAITKARAEGLVG